MSRRRLRWAVAAVVAAVAAGIWLGGARESPSQEAAPAPSTALFEDPVFVGYQQGVPQWRLAAERITEEAEGYRFHRIWDGQLFQDGEPYLAFTSDEAFWVASVQLLTLQGSVEVARDGEPLLRTDRLVWDGRAGVLRAPGPVQVNLDGRHFRAGSLTFDPEAERLELSHDVELEVSGEGRMRIPGKAVYDMRSKRMATYGPGELAVPSPPGG